MRRRPPASNPYQSDIRIIWDIISLLHTTIAFAAQSCILPYPSCPDSAPPVSIGFARSYEKKFGQALDVGKISLFRESALQSDGKLWRWSILVADERDNLVTRHSHGDRAHNSM